MPCVYVLTNPAIPDLVKIGYTAGTAADRAAQISQGTGVPAPYAVAWFCETTTAQAAAQLERYTHQHCAGNRVNRAREFFRMTVPAAAAVIESIGYTAGMIAITSPEIAERTRAAQEQARAAQERARAEQAERRRIEQASIRAQMEVSLGAQERARVEQAERRRVNDQQTAFWFIAVGLLLLLTPVFFISFILFFLAWMHLT